MALDHFIPQVYLKNFYSPVLGDKLFAIRKSDLKVFTPGSNVVCCIGNGSTNKYLSEERVVEDFLLGIEPKYNRAIENFRIDKISDDDIYVVSGLISYILTCSPAGMRTQAAPMQRMIEDMGRFIDAQGDMPPSPIGLEGSSFSELLDAGAIKVEVDLKYPQAIGIASILRLTTAFGNFYWDIMINNCLESPFFTSDFPVAIEKSSNPLIFNRIIPLSPWLAVRIFPHPHHDTSKDDCSFSGFRSRVRNISKEEVRRINELIVRCGESLVFFRDDHEWVARFVKRNAAYRIEPKSFRIPQPNGPYLINTLEIRAIRSS